MYVSLKEIVKNLAQSKKLEWKNYEKSVWYIDNDFSKKRISVDGAMDALKKEFRYEFNDYDYKDIRKRLEAR